MQSLTYRSVGEWSVSSPTEYANPFTAVRVSGVFVSPSGVEFTMPGFYDGDGTWRVRFNPGETGRWKYDISAYPDDPQLVTEGEFEVTPAEVSGFLKATPGDAWGFRYEDGTPAFLLGDTVYNLFGAAYCDLDVKSFMARRAQQGYNFLRVRAQVSPFHPPEGHSTWQTRRTWPWGGSEQSPLLDRFNLDYFRTVDAVVWYAESLGLGLEFIMEAWGFEFPFNDRNVFTAEYEELWLRYLVARYDAFNSLYFWTIMNEYEFYPDGVIFGDSTRADLWAMRIGRWLKVNAPHGHAVAVHNTMQTPFAERFAADPAAIDAVMYQGWGPGGEDRGWLSVNVENLIGDALAGWWGSAVFVEYGYERNPELPITFPPFVGRGPDHTRRGAWRGAFCAVGVANGFENTWGPVMILDRDQPGAADLARVRQFFTEVLPFENLRPTPEIIASGPDADGYGALALASPDRTQVAVYIPAGGSATLALDGAYDSRWYDPRTGEQVATTGGPTYTPPGGESAPNRPFDWVLVLTRT